MIRICHVIKKMDRGGAETLIMNVFRAVDRTKVQFDFLVHSAQRGDYDDEIEALGGRIFRIGMPSPIKLPRYYLQCKKFFTAHPEISIVHGHLGSTAAFYLKAAEQTGKYTIAHSHSQNYPLSPAEIAFKIVSYPTRYIADYFMGASFEALRDRYGYKIAQSSRSMVLPNGIDTKAFAFSNAARTRIREELNISADSRVYVDVARLTLQKNHDFLLDVFADLVERNPDSRLLLVGRGELADDLKAKTSHLGVADKVIFLGVRSDVADVLSASDFFVLTSFSEGLCIAAIEAQANGLSCFLSPGVPSFVDCGKDVHFIDISAGKEIWVDTLQEAAKSLPDLSSRSCGVEYVKDHGFDISQTVSWLEQFYLEPKTS